MLIPLDYYRILTVPLKANKAQIERAYQDRVQQKPHREYSEIAIAARQSLLQQAYGVLGDPTQRSKYDEKLLTPMVADPEQAVSATANTMAIAPTLEISPQLLSGALIILHELAEYEQIIRLGNYYLNNSAYLEEVEADKKQSTLDRVTSETIKAEAAVSFQDKDLLRQGSSFDPREDIILAMTLSYLELGREKWRIQEYETAAYLAQVGLNLLKQEQRFYMLQEELATDLYQLRPYRILNLLANAPADSPERATGLRLLQEMLEQRQGIEGKGKDYSGLKCDKFLGFIQQVRRYLTTTEQIKLFVAEAKRPSFVATYLAMYALLAQGYATKQPKMILKAEAMLQSLSKRQEDVYWEQAICALLLGRAEQAYYALEKSQEKATVELVKQYSRSSPDLLPGLCFYGEKWLLQEVLSQFRDLIDCQVTLADYFADPKVESYLNQLSPVQTKPQNAPQVEVRETAPNSNAQSVSQWLPWKKSERKSAPMTQGVYRAANTTAKNNSASKVTLASATATLEKQQAAFAQNQVSQPRTAPASLGGNKKPRNQKKLGKRRKKRASNLIKGSLLSLSLIVGLGALGFVFTNNMLRRAAEESEAEFVASEIPPIIGIEEPLVTLPEADTASSEPEIAQPTQILDPTIAKNIVETWLNSKSAAFGNQYNIDQLNNILAPSMLTMWRDRALHFKQNQIHRQYEHTVKIRSVDFSENNPDRAVIEAEVQEIAQHYQQGKLNSAESYDDNLVVRYQLIRQGESWLIDKSEVVKTL
ncbi:MAG TPA: IMS domain-containing protein [Xenococcaceae cyanobacterium]